MKWANGEWLTTSELLEEIFGMEERIIYNTPEVVRYEKIYNYLMKNEAQIIGRRKTDSNSYIIFNLAGERYFIPENIFDENDDNWKIDSETNHTFAKDNFELRIV